MPEVSRFFGIIIRMFVEAGRQHIRLTFTPIIKTTLESTISTRSSVWLVRYQSASSQEELLSNWQRLQEGRPAIKIEPLK